MKIITFNAPLNHKAYSYEPMQIEVEKVITLYGKRFLALGQGVRVDIVLTKSISRFARNTLDLLETVRHLKELGVEVRFEKEHINSFSGDGELMLSILASFAQEESRSISENVKWGVRKRFQSGEIGAANKHILGYR